MDYIMSLPLGEVGYERLIIRPKKKTLRILRTENGKKGSNNYRRAMN